MNKELKSLIKAKLKWENNIKLYKEFLKGKTKTFEGRCNAKEYISMAKNRINDINQKLKEIENQT